MKKVFDPYYVILWDANRKTVEHYDVMPYLRDVYLKDKKSKSKYAKHPQTFDEFKKFILNESKYQFWCRCEYEVIVSAWPPHAKRDKRDGEIKFTSYTVYDPEKRDIPTIDFYDYKLDAFEQIEMNIDVITSHFMKQLQPVTKKKCPKQPKPASTNGWYDAWVERGGIL